MLSKGDGHEVTGAWDLTGSEIIGKFGDAFVVFLAEAFTEEWDEWEEWAVVAEMLGEPGARVFDVADVTVDFVADERNELKAGNLAIEWNAENRVAAKIDVAGVDGAVLFADFDVPFFEAAVIEGAAEVFGDVERVEVDVFELFTLRFGEKDGVWRRFEWSADGFVEIGIFDGAVEVADGGGGFVVGLIDDASDDAVGGAELIEAMIEDVANGLIGG